MICPECETEYREGFTRCSDCDVALVDELGAPPLAPLTMDTSPELIGALVEALEAQSIPYVIHAGTALRIMDGEEESLDAPDPWHARIWVTPERADEAQELLEELREALKQQALSAALTDRPPRERPT